MKAINDNLKYNGIKRMNAVDHLEMTFWLIENNVRQIKDRFSRTDIQQMVKDILLEVKALEEICLQHLRRN